MSPLCWVANWRVINYVRIDRWLKGQETLAKIDMFGNKDSSEIEGLRMYWKTVYLTKNILINEPKIDFVI